MRVVGRAQGRVRGGGFLAAALPRGARRFRFAAACAASLLAGCAGEREPITPPRQLPAESPFQYPEELWDAQVEGETMLRLYITEAGAVDSVRVERTSGYEAFDSAALAGGRALRFRPARRGSEPVGAWFILPVKFDLGPAADSAGGPSKSQQVVAP